MLTYSKKRKASSGSSRATSRSTAVAGGVLRALATGERGSYVGRVKRPRRPAPPGRYAKLGFRASMERFGQQTATDVVYIGIPSVRPRDVAVAVGAAFWRMALKKHCHMEISDPMEKINWERTGAAAIEDPGIRRINFWRRYRTAAGAEVVDIGYSQIIQIANQTLMDLAQDFAENVFMDFGNAFGNLPTTLGYGAELYGYQVVQKDATNLVSGAPTESYERKGPVIPIYNQNVSAYYLAKLTFQNVSPADNHLAGDAYDADRIDRNPVVGKLYKFGTISPVVRDMYGTGNNLTGVNAAEVSFDVNNDGLILPSIALTGKFAQVPTPDMFRYVKGVANVKLEPGHMKDLAVKFKFSGNINKLMKGLAGHRLSTGLSGIPFDESNEGFGQSLLLCLEKRLSTGSSGLAINYQLDTHYGAVLGRRPTTVMQPFAVGGNQAIAYTGIVAGEPAKDA